METSYITSTDSGREVYYNVIAQQYIHSANEMNALAWLDRLSRDISFLDARVA